MSGAARIITLGTSSASPTSSRNVSAVLYIFDGTTILFDCGEGTQHRIAQSPVRASTIEAICITHLHGDHVYGVPGLLATLGMQGRERPLVVCGPPGIRTYLERTIAATYLRLPYQLSIVESSSGVAISRDDFTITALPLEHTVPCVGYRLEEPERDGKFDVTRARVLGVPDGPLFGELQHGRDVTLADGRVVCSSEVVGAKRGGRAIAYCSDTRPCANGIALARGVDLLIHEATYGEDLVSEAMARLHSTAREAATVARDSGALRLLLTHFSSRYEDPEALAAEAREIFPATTAAHDFHELAVAYRD